MHLQWQKMNSCIFIHFPRKMIRNLTIDEFFQLPDSPPLADVRTPAEFIKGHIPGASNVPLFSNEERAQVGTTYKQIGREAAILLGFDLTGSKWSGYIRQCLTLSPGKRIGIHCWRGGMRSGAMAWALDLYGFEVYLIRGGYKAYRRSVRELFAVPYVLSILGGMTGTGKTRLLQALKTERAQVIDLEDLAQHKGSSYGTMNKLVQPTQEQFENNLARQLQHIDPTRQLWLEDESQNIGKCTIPPELWRQMRSAPLINLQMPVDQRVNALVEEYGCLDRDFLIQCTERIHKRLGSEQTKQAVAAIRENRMDDFIRIVLVYYDKTYRKGLSTRDVAKIFPLDVTGENTAVDLLRLHDFLTSNLLTITHMA
jgi:tRNA 2-selenouridine synthase